MAHLRSPGFQLAAVPRFSAINTLGVLQGVGLPGSLFAPVGNARWPVVEGKHEKRKRAEEMEDDTGEKGEKREREREKKRKDGRMKVGRDSEGDERGRRGRPSEGERELTHRATSPVDDSFSSVTPGQNRRPLESNY